MTQRRRVSIDGRKRGSDKEMSCVFSLAGLLAAEQCLSYYLLRMILVVNMPQFSAGLKPHNSVTKKHGLV